MCDLAETGWQEAHAHAVLPVVSSTIPNMLVTLIKEREKVKARSVENRKEDPLRQGQRRLGGAPRLQDEDHKAALDLQVGERNHQEEVVIHQGAQEHRRADENTPLEEEGVRHR